MLLSDGSDGNDGVGDGVDADQEAWREYTQRVRSLRWATSRTPGPTSNQPLSHATVCTHFLNRLDTPSANADIRVWYASVPQTK